MKIEVYLRKELFRYLFGPIFIRERYNSKIFMKQLPREKESYSMGNRNFDF